MARGSTWSGSSYTGLGSPFSCSAGDTPTASTGILATGIWSFELQVTDGGTPADVVYSNAATVTVNPALTAPAVSVSPSPIDSGQSSTLSTTTSFGGGTSPYTCQWLVEGPSDSSYGNLGASFSCNAGDTPSTPTGALSAIGAWSFELQVTDGSGIPATVISNAVTVSVNPALTAPPAPSVSASFLDVDQALTLTGAVPSTGTPTYSWQWLVSVNGGAYAAATQCSTNSGSGANAGDAETCDVAASTLTVGDTYAFELQVTDSATLAETQTSPYSSTVTVNSALEAPAAPSTSVTLLDVNQALTVTGTMPTTGTPTYSWQWMISVNGGGYAPATQCAVDSGTGASTGATETCSISTDTLTIGDTYAFELAVADSASSPESATSSASSTVAVSSALTAPVTPGVSATSLDLNQALTVTSTMPATGTSTYSWVWLVSVNGGAFGATTLCATSSGSGASASAIETCSIPAGTLTVGDTYSFELKVSDSASTPESGTSAASSTVAAYSALTAPAAPAVSAAALYKSQTLTVTDTIPTTGTPTYSWQWLVSVNGGTYAAATQCATNSGTGASGGATVTCTTSGSSLKVGGTYNFELEVSDSASSPEAATSPASPTVTVQTPTTIVFACLPLTGMVSVPEVCGVVVVNNEMLYNARPSGIVTFSGTLPPGMPTSCTLTGGAGILNACVISWTHGKGTEGSYSIMATYGGDSTHGSSSAHGSLVIGKRSISVTISCTSPYTHNVPMTCTVKVTDNSPGTAITPTSTVTFTSSGPGMFSPTGCTLSGSGATASCHVTFTPSSKGSYTVTVTYGGDTDHASGVSSTTFKVT